MSILDSLQTVFLKPNRAIGGIMVQVALEEIHVDELEITDHPVELNANISDHAFMKPFEVTLRMLWGNNAFSTILNDISGAINNIGNANAPDSFSNLSLNNSVTTYQQLQALQQSLKPFSIVTGKRSYTNMLLRTLKVETTVKTENSLLVTAYCRQVILVNTALTAIPPNDVQANPQSNATPVQGPQQNLTAAPNYTPWQNPG